MNIGTAFLNSLFWFLFAFVLAAMEIESHGKKIWADGLPTWYRVTGPISRIFAWAMDGKPLTGYHLFMFLIPLAAVHASFFPAIGGMSSWTWEGELMALSLYFLLALTWDFLWYVLNPDWNLKDFRSGGVWMYKHWVLGRIPRDYVFSFLLSWVFIFPAVYLDEANFPLVYVHSTCLKFFGLFVLITLVFSPYYRRWRKQMLEIDEHELVKTYYPD